MKKPDLKSAGPGVEESSSSVGNFYFIGCWLLDSVGLQVHSTGRGLTDYYHRLIAQIDRAAGWIYPG